MKLTALCPEKEKDILRTRMTHRLVPGEGERYP